MPQADYPPTGMGAFSGLTVTRAPQTKQARAAAFNFQSDESIDKRRELIVAALRKELEPKAKKETPNCSPCGSIDYYVRDLSPMKVVYEFEGKTYGRVYSIDSGTGEVSFKPPVEVNQQWVGVDSDGKG